MASPLQEQKEGGRDSGGRSKRWRAVGEGCRMKPGRPVRPEFQIHSDRSE